jgi:hypothetical protein
VARQDSFETIEGNEAGILGQGMDLHFQPRREEFEFAADVRADAVFVGMPWSQIPFSLRAADANDPQPEERRYGSAVISSWENG